MYTFLNRGLFMNNDFNKIGEEGTKRTDSAVKNSLAGTIGLTVLVAALTILPSANIFPTVSEILAAALFANLIAVRKTPAAAYISTVISGACSIFLTKSVFAGLVPVLAVCAVGTAVAVCIIKKAGLVTSSAAAAVIFLVTLILPFCYGVYSAYGSVIEGTRTYFSEVFDEYARRLTEVFEVGGGITLQYESVRAMFSEAALLIPGMVALMAEVFGCLVYVGSNLISKLRRKDVREFYPKGLRVDLGAELGVFFIVTSVFTLIASGFESADVLFYALMNFLVILVFPMTVYGVYVMVRNLKAPRIVIKMENGEEFSPMRFSFLWIVVPLIFINFAMAILFTAFYGAVKAISNGRKSRIGKEKEQ